MPSKFTLYDVLNCTKYGYRLDNVTERPLTNNINKVEKVLYLNITTLVNFWDVRRAFDSTSYTTHCMVLTRYSTRCG
jgi:hypothetical protein